MKRNIFWLLVVVMSMFSVLSCSEKQGNTGNILEVTPSDVINCAASDNAPIVLNVNTDASSWTYTVPEWINAAAQEKTLTLNVMDNPDAEERTGKVTVEAAGVAPVVIPVIQAANVPDGAVKAVLSDNESGNTDIDMPIDVNSVEDVTVALKVELEKPLQEASEVTVVFDVNYLDAYLESHPGATCDLMPFELVSIADGGKVSIPAGETSVTFDMTIKTDSKSFESFIDYLIPLKAVSNDKVVFESEGRVNYIITKTSLRTIKNLAYLEVNDTNPLNLLEFKLADGSLFFDATVIFSSNIIYDQYNDIVKLYNNPNNQALLDETDVYLQPLREKGIKVYLGLLGHHTPAGLCNLSDWGAQMFAEEIAETVRDYKLDGIAVDDEYSKDGIVGNKWFAQTSADLTIAGSRLLYYIKEAMKEKCPWNTEVGVYKLNGFNRIEVFDEHVPGDFVDWWCGDYGLSTYPLEGMTLANCCARSVEIRKGKGFIGSPEEAKAMKDKGYGWIMWFGLDPSNYGSAMAPIEHTAMGLYEQELQPVTGYYKKIGEGKYDPERYEL